MNNFGELRSLLHATPDEDTWLTLCQKLTAWPTDQLETQVVPYIESHIRSWDDVLRAVPTAWIRRAFKDMTTPGYGLCRVLDTRMFRPRFDEWEMLFQSKYTSTMTHFYVGTSCLSASDIPAFLKVELWPSLRVLLLDDNPTLGSTGLSGIANAPWSSIEELYLENCRVHADHLAAIWRNPAFEQCAVLEVSGAKLKNLAEEALPPDGMPNLATLNLSWSRWSLSGLTVFSDVVLPALRHLNMTGCDWLSTDLQAVIDASWFEHLNELNLNWNQLGDAGVDLLSQRRLPHLRRLDLQRNGLTTKGLRMLKEHPAFAHVEVMKVAWNRGLHDDPQLHQDLLNDSRFQW